MYEYKILLLLLIVVVSGITDLLNRKIYNCITFPGVVMGVALNCHIHGFNGLITSLLGFIICAVIFIILFIWGGFGAGDVKLMMAIGAIAGHKLIFDLILYSAIAGGIMANIVIIKNKKFIQTWKNVLRFFLFLVPKYHLISEPLEKKNSILIPYGYAISMGTIVYILINHNKSTDYVDNVWI